MFVLTASRKAGCLANLANPSSNQESLYTVGWLSTRRPDDCLAQKEGSVSEDDLLFSQKARHCDLTHWYPLRGRPLLIHLMAVLEATRFANDWQSAVFKILDAHRLLMMFSKSYEISTFCIFCQSPLLSCLSSSYRFLPRPSQKNEPLYVTSTLSSKMAPPLVSTSQRSLQSFQVFSKNCKFLLSLLLKNVQGWIVSFKILAFLLGFL